MIFRQLLPGTKNYCTFFSCSGVYNVYIWFTLPSSLPIYVLTLGLPKEDSLFVRVVTVRRGHLAKSVDEHARARRRPRNSLLYIEYHFWAVGQHFLRVELVQKVQLLLGED